MQFRVERQVKFGRFNEDLKHLLSKVKRETKLKQLESLVSNDMTRVKLLAPEGSEAMFRTLALRQSEY